MATKFQWDLTTDELADLKERIRARRGRLTLIESIQRLYGLEAEAEAAWWEAVANRLKIKEEDRHNLIAAVDTKHTPAELKENRISP